MKHSRHLGSLSFCEDGDESVVDAAVTIAQRPAPATLVVADVAAFDEAAVQRLDSVLDGLDEHDTSARERIAADLGEDGTTVAEYWRFFHDEVEGWQDRTPGDFLDALVVVRVGIFPDGAWARDSVLSIDYGIEDPETDQLLVARFPDGQTPVISWES
ncbi:hypothetical protein [Microbacterium gorillae]|uniref:hypothetical protein n=1 Tax=Microbacterium gorillae TaxID=1231063 RepID=UPI003D96B4BD